MTLKYADRVLETSTTQGTLEISLNGRTDGFQTFIEGVGDGAKVAYTIEDGQRWETGIGTVTAGSPDKLSRDRIIGSSAGGSPVNWGAGTRNVFLSATAYQILWRDENGNDTNQLGVGGGTANVHTIQYDHIIADYSDRMVIRWFATVQNTAAVTVNVNGLGAIAYVRADGTNFALGDIKAGTLQEAFFDEANNRFIKAGSGNASSTGFNNAGTGLVALNTQDAITELNAKVLPKADKAAAEAGTSDDLIMTALRVAQAIVAQQSGDRKIQTVTIAPGTSQVLFANLNPEFDYYSRFADVFCSINSEICLRTSTNNGTGFATGASDYGWSGQQCNNSGVAGYSGVNSYSVICRAVGNASNLSGCFGLYIRRPNSNLTVTQYESSGILRGANPIHFTLSGYRGVAEANNAIVILPVSVATFQGGIIDFWGKKP